MLKKQGTSILMYNVFNCWLADLHSTLVAFAYDLSENVLWLNLGFQTQKQCNNIYDWLFPHIKHWPGSSIDGCVGAFQFTSYQ